MHLSKHKILGCSSKPELELLLRRTRDDLDKLEAWGVQVAETLDATPGSQASMHNFYNPTNTGGESSTGSGGSSSSGSRGSPSRKSAKVAHERIMNIINPGKKTRTITVTGRDERGGRWRRCSLEGGGVSRVEAATPHGC